MILSFFTDAREPYSSRPGRLTPDKAAGMTLELKNCDFFSDAIEYFGHGITPGRLHVAINTKESVRKLTHPKNITELRFFLGLCDVYRRFVWDFAREAAPLNKMLQK